MRRNLEQLSQYSPLELAQQGFENYEFTKRLANQDGAVQRLYSIVGEFASEIINLARQDPMKQIATAQEALDVLDLQRGAYDLKRPNVYRIKNSVLSDYRNRLVQEKLALPRPACIIDSKLIDITATIIEGIPTVTQTRKQRAARQQIHDLDIIAGNVLHTRGGPGGINRTLYRAA